MTRKITTQLTDAVVIRYKGDGSNYIPGVPTRDMTADEWESLPESLRYLAVQTDLYVAVQKTESE